MKLKDCVFGVPVITNKGDRRVLGHIVGFTYNVDVSLTGGMDREDLLSKTIALVKWADSSESGIHPANIEKFKG